MRKSALFVLSVCIGLSICAQETISGFVYNDANLNGKKEKREPGVSSVGVSNGRDIVLTNTKGFYTIPVVDGQTIFVIKPSGYKTAVDDHFIPRFYYHHRLKGTPESFKYKGIAPTGKLPRSLDFALIKYDEPLDYSTIVFGDPQPYSIADLDAFSKKIVADVKKKDNTLFGISLGDIVGNNLDLQPIYKERMKPLGLPWYNVMGNHDMNFDATVDELSDETFEKNFGSANYAFNYGNAHFIILDDILYPDPRDGQGYWAGYRKDQLEFLENDLKLVPKDKLVILSQHIQMKDSTGNGFRQEDKKHIFNLLKDYENVLLMSAHTHFQEQIYYTKKDGWLGSEPLHEYNVGTTSGDWYSGKLDENGNPDATMRDGTPQGYAFLNIKNNKYSFDYKVAGKEPEYQMNIYAPKVVPHKGKTSSEIMVNFFMGTQKNLVEYRIGDGKWRKMHYIESIDPSYYAKLMEWDFTESLLPGRRPSNGVKSTHLWAGKLDLDLQPGEHIIEVKATDSFGKDHYGKRSYKILAQEN